MRISAEKHVQIFRFCTKNSSRGSFLGCFKNAKDEFD